MELSKLKHLVRENGDKIILMENGEPEVVVMSFAEYEKLARLNVSASRNIPRTTPAARTPESMVRDADSDRMHETEFLTPIDTGPIRASASLAGYARPIVREQEESGRGTDIRLEDLPI